VGEGGSSDQHVELLLIVCLAVSEKAVHFIRGARASFRTALRVSSRAFPGINKSVEGA